MELQLHRGVKDVITDHPEVGRILDDFGVGCTACALGTCLLKDVVGIHNLSADTEADLMYQIEKAIYPEREVARREVSRGAPLEAEPFQFSPPLQSLVDEHKVIKRWLALIPAVVHRLLQGGPEAWSYVQGGTRLMQEYADRLHHAKEEDILFDYVDRSSEIIQVMCQDHVQGREHRRLTSEAADSGLTEQAAAHLMAYGELLLSHIKREDEILFPWIDRTLSVAQVGRLHALFADVDSGALETTAVHLAFLDKAEEWVDKTA